MEIRVIRLIFIATIICSVCYGGDPIRVQWNQTVSNTSLPNFEVLSYYLDTEDNATVARLIVEIPENQKSNASLLFSYQTRDRSRGSQVPNVIYNVSHYIIAKTLCPFTRRENLTVQVRSYEPVKFNLTAWKIDYFHLRGDTKTENRVFIIQPQFFEYTFEKNVDVVNIEITSKSNDCMIVSVQEKRCPVFDQNNKVLPGSSFLTMTTNATMSVSRNDFTDGVFYVVLVKSKDDDCHADEVSKKDNTDPRAGKHFTITVTEAKSDIAGPILVLTLLYAVIVAVSIAYILFDQESEKEPWRQFLSAEDDLVVNSQENFNDSDSVQILISSYDLLLDTDDPEVIRRKKNLKVSDLCMHPWEQRNDKFSKYYISLITVALFYALPVVQFVLDHVKNVHRIGNLDLCWFNFRCARSLTVGSYYFFAFNNILSNIGYVVLGILYLLMTKERDRRYQAWIKLGRNVKEVYGLPQHPGISYAIGIAVIMEGVMSMSYHVCPSAENFQFDTAFMFICAILGMMKIYQLRHPDIVVKSHKAFFTLGIIIFFVSVGVKFNIMYTNFNPFWVLYAILYPLLMIITSVEFYFKGALRCSLGEMKTSIFHSFASSRWYSWGIRRQKGRFFFLAVGNIVNLLFVVFGLLVRPHDFASFLLFPLILNLLLYLMYYIVMKFANGERLSLSALLFLALSSALWAVSLWYFTNNVADWALRPAESRQINKNCIDYFEYFDKHDIWHICSSLAIFISFTLIDRLDDDLRFTKRCKIPAF